MGTSKCFMYWNHKLISDNEKKQKEPSKLNNNKEEKLNVISH